MINFAVGLILAFVRTTDPSGHVIAWTRPTFTLVVGAALPPGVSRAALLTALRDAARVWTEVECSSIAISVEDAPARQLTAARDGVSAVVPHLIAWCSDERGRDCHDSLSPALTSTRFGARRGRGPAPIEEADIEINAVDYRWDDDLAQNGADLQMILTHEIGHALGLADACRMPGSPAASDDTGRPVLDCFSSPAAVRQSVMWPLGSRTDRARRQLSDEDRRAVCALYPRKGTR